MLEEVTRTRTGKRSAAKRTHLLDVHIWRDVHRVGARAHVGPHVGRDGLREPPQEPRPELVQIVAAHELADRALRVQPVHAPAQCKMHKERTVSVLQYISKFSTVQHIATSQCLDSKTINTKPIYVKQTIQRDKQLTTISSVRRIHFSL